MVFYISLELEGSEAEAAASKLLTTICKIREGDHNNMAEPIVTSNWTQHHRRPLDHKPSMKIPWAKQ